MMRSLTSCKANPIDTNRSFNIQAIIYRASEDRFPIPTRPPQLLLDKQPQPLLGEPPKPENDGWRQPEQREMPQIQPIEHEVPTCRSEQNQLYDRQTLIVPK